MPKVVVEVRIKPNKKNILEYNQNRITVGTKTYTFSKVHNKISQKEFFESSIIPFLNNFIKGENCSILAYGQTGSGKTYTIGICHHTGKLKEDKAIIHYCLEFLSKLGLKLSCSFIEIYNENIVDLLSNTRVPLNIRQGIDDTAIVGLSEREINSYEDGIMFLNQGSDKRTTSSTKMNNESSRSHAIFTLILRRNQESSIIESKMSFVDLAGSERLKRTQVTGSAKKESININSGLLSLGNVINALYMNKTHVPFRDSKLTRILQKCLVGHVLLIACISGLQDDLFETTNTLKYASRAALISLNEKVHIENDKDKIIVQNLKKEISKLRDENMKLRSMMIKSAIKNDEILNHPFVINLINVIKTLNPNFSNFDTLIDSSSFSQISQFTEENKKNNFIAESFSKKLEIQNKKKVLFGQNKEKNILGRINVKEADSDSDMTVYYPDDFEFEKNKLTLENTQKNIEISPFIDDKKTEDLANRKRKKLVTFNTTSDILEYKNKVIVKPIETITDVSAISLIMHSNKLIFNSQDSKIRVYENGKSTILLSDDTIRCIYSAGDLYYSTRSLLKMYNTNGHTRALPVYAYKKEITCLKIYNNLSFTGHEDGSLCILDLKSNELLVNQKVHTSSIFDILIDGNILYTCSKDKRIKFNEIRNFSKAFFEKSEFDILETHSDVVSSLMQYKNKNISLSRDCSIKYWGDEKNVTSIPFAHDSWIKTGAIFNDFFVTGCKGGYLKFWDISQNLQCVGKYDTNSGINCMVRDEDYLWVGCQNKTISKYTFL